MVDSCLYDGQKYQAYENLLFLLEYAVTGKVTVENIVSILIKICKARHIAGVDEW